MDDLKEALERARRQYLPPEDPFEVFSRRRVRHERARRFATISVALTVGLAGVAGMFLAFDRTDDTEVASSIADLSLPDGSYYYERIDRYNLIRYPGTLDVETASDELWLAPDGSGRFVFDGEILNYEPITGGGAHQDHSFAAGGSPWEWVDLPADPADMRQVLLARGAPDGPSPVPPTPSPGIVADDWRIMKAAQDLLDRQGLYLAPPQRRALFLVLRDMSFFEVTTGATDPLGRSATELSVVLDGSRILWYFDGASGQWLARVVEKPSTGEVVLADVMIQQGVVADTASTLPESPFVGRPRLAEPDFLSSE